VLRRSAVSACLGFMLLLFISSGAGAAEVLYPTFGTGNRELIVFTDYFCSPCAKVETALLGAIRQVLTTGGWKVSFVDIPGHDDTQLYARYFIYAVQSGKGEENALRARSLLFDLAGRG